MKVNLTGSLLSRLGEDCGGCAIEAVLKARLHVLTLGAVDTFQLF
jgi:hypothetical protein